ncbi:MAG: hypothetical protein Tsb0021_16030 [Chlamydiales bacterium]
MITLTVKAYGYDYQQSFNKDSIILGAGLPTEVDVPIDEEGIAKEHVVIVLEEDHYTVTNVTHDPYVSLNGLAFGKRHLSQGDHIYIRDVAIECTEVDTGEEQKFHPHHRSSDLDIHRLLREVDNLDQENSFGKESSQNLPFLNVSSFTNSFLPSRRWGKILGFASLTLFFSIVLTAYFLLNYHDSEDYEMKAALAVSDAGMSLLHSHILDPKTLQQNWTNLERLQDPLSQLIGSKVSPLYSLTPEGEFLDGKYLLRLFSNQDGSRFLIVAQPLGKMAAWLSSKKAFVLDSDMMEIKVIEDIRALNKALLAPQLFDDPFANAVIVNLLSKAQSYDLREIRTIENSKDFIPPKGLDFIRPGAERLVYNMPRYYRFTEHLMNQAANEDRDTLLSGKSKFQDEFSRLLGFNNLVFYTSDGYQTAVHAYEMLNMFFPQEEYLVGSLQIDPSMDLISNNLLLTMRGTQLPHPFINKNRQLSGEEELKENQAGHPHFYLFNEMIALNAERAKALEPHTIAVSNLFAKNQQKAQPRFKEELSSLLEQYEKTEEDYLNKISKVLLQLYEDYHLSDPQASSNQFISLAYNAGLDQFTEAQLKHYIEENQNDRVWGEQLELMLQDLRNTYTLQDLEFQVSKIRTYLDRVPETSSFKLIAQNRLKKEIFLHFEELLIQSENQTNIEDQDKIALKNLLDSSGSSEEEKRYYLNIFNSQKQN